MASKKQKPSKAAKQAAAKQQRSSPVIRVAQLKSRRGRDVLVRVTADGSLSSKDAARTGRKTVGQDFVAVPAATWAEATRRFKTIRPASRAGKRSARRGA